MGDLQDNGGPTFTHSLLIDSPAIDAGDTSKATLGGNTITTDQRGYTRVGDNSTVANATTGIDIGAVEVIGVTIGDVSASEAAGALNFDITLSHLPGPGDDVTFELDTVALTGQATPGSDYTVTVSYTHLTLPTKA